MNKDEKSKMFKKYMNIVAYHYSIGTDESIINELVNEAVKDDAKPECFDKKGGIWLMPDETMRRYLSNLKTSISFLKMFADISSEYPGLEYQLTQQIDTHHKKMNRLLVFALIVVSVACLVLTYLLVS